MLNLKTFLLSTFSITPFFLSLEPAPAPSPSTHIGSKQQKPNQPLHIQPIIGGGGGGEAGIGGGGEVGGRGSEQNATHSRRLSSTQETRDLAERLPLTENDLTEGIGAMDKILDSLKDMDTKEKLDEGSKNMLHNKL